MFKCLVKFNGQEPQLFGIPNVAYAKTLATMDDVEWVVGPIGDNGILFDVSASTSLMGEVNVKPIKPKYVPPHFCPTHPTGVLTPLAMTKVKRAIQEHRKIQAIKEVREATNWTLKGAKDFVDFLCFWTNWPPA